MRASGEVSALRLLWQSRFGRWMLIGGMVATIALFVGAMTFRSARGLLSRDSEQYWDIGRNLAQGRGFSFDGHTPTAMREPLYPLVVAGMIAVFGKTVLPVQILQCLMAIGTVLIVAAIAVELGGPKTGAVAALLAGLYYPFGVMATEIRTESLYTLLMAGIALRWVLVVKRESIRPAAVCGLLIGVATITRSVGVVFIVLIPVALWFQVGRGSRAWRTAGAVVGIAVLPLIPWAVRNEIALGELRVLSNAGPVSMYMGMHPMALSNWEDYMTAIEQTEEYHRLRGNDQYLGEEAARRFRRATIERVKSDPLGTAWRSVAKVVLAWSYPPGARPVLRASALRFALLRVPQILLLALTCYGVLTGPRWLRWIALLMFLGVSSTIIVGAPTARYTLPFMPLGLAAAALPLAGTRSAKPPLPSAGGARCS